MVDRTLVIGVTVGSIGLGVSLLLEPLTGGRLVGDPIPLFLALNHLITGLTTRLRYYHWQPPLLHVVFALIVGVISAVFHRLYKREGSEAHQAERVARIASLLNLAAAALPEIDTITVALWYLISGYFSLTLSGFAGRSAAKVLNSSKAQVASAPVTEVKNSTS